MKNLPLLFILFLISITAAYSQDDPRKWSIDPRSTLIVPGEDQTHEFQVPPEHIDYKHPNKVPLYQKLRDGSEAIVFPNFRVFPSIFTQSETPITSHPTNKNIMFASSNSVKFGPTFISEGVYVTTDGGETWFGSDTTKAAPITDHWGDPAPAIDLNGRFYQSYLKNQSTTAGMYASFSTDYGVTWANSKVLTTASSDKNHTFVINNPASPYNGRVIVTWSDFSASNPPAVVSYSTDGGNTWSPKAAIHTVASGHYAQGVNGAMGPDGEVYIVWQNPVSSSPFTGDFVGFAKSTNGGVNWTFNNNIYDCNGIRGTLTNKSSIRVNDFPWMGVDLTNGSRRGWIYVVTAEKNLAPAGSDPDIVFHRSTDGGTTWSPGIRVNQDPLNNGKDQYMPALIVDQLGAINVVYYDSRNTTSDSAEVWMSRSTDGGNTWSDIRVSDHRFKPKPISGLASGYQGDYIGITEGPGGSIWPYWCSDRSGIYQAWTAKVVFETFPLNVFNLNTPAPGDTITSFPNSLASYSFTWDTSASTASYNWIFGNPDASSRQLVRSTSANSISFTGGQIDNMLAGLGISTGGSTTGSWDVWAYRNNFPDNDSLKAANGPRSITFIRGIPQLIVFNLNLPANNSTITTSVFNNNNVVFNWTKSGDGVKYRIKFGQTLTNPLLNILAPNDGYDTSWTIVNSGLDLLLQNAGLNAGDSVAGVYAVFAYSGADSLKSVQTFNLTMKRQAKGDVLVAYDSSSTNGRISRDSVLANLNTAGRTYDLFNKGSQTSTNVISLLGYKTVIWLGEATSVMSVIQKDSIKAYLNSGTPENKSKLMIFSEDIGYQFGRTGSTYYDLNFINEYLGWNYLADRPGSAAHGIIGVSINTGQTDSTIGTWPDCFAPFGPYSEVLYRFRNFPDSASAIGNRKPNFEVATFGVDVRSLRRASDSPAGSPVTRLLFGGLTYVPVELTSFTGNASNGAVSLIWSTSSEINNQGFEIERRTEGQQFTKVGFIPGYGTTSEIQNYIFTDDNVSLKKYFYRLKQLDYNGSYEYSTEIEVDIPLTYSLDQNYPNPFNPSTTIKYSIPNDEMVKMIVYNLLGEKVLTLVNEFQKAGKYEINFDASKFASGLYFYRIESGSFTSVKKMMLLK